jgi:hypothetical protein
MVRYPILGLLLSAASAQAQAVFISPVGGAANHGDVVIPSDPRLIITADAAPDPPEAELAIGRGLAVVLQPDLPDDGDVHPAGYFQATWRPQAPGRYTARVLLPDGREVGTLAIVLAESRRALRDLDLGGAHGQVVGNVKFRFRIDAPAVDADGDGLLDWHDTCPEVANPDQADRNDDGAGDACAPDPCNDRGPGFVLDPATGACHCAVILDCDAPQVFDEDTCLCACPVDGCPPDHVFDPDACRCEQVPCGPGLTRDKDGACQPDDPCSVFNGGCHMFATCTATGPGTRTCACPAGFAGDGVTHCDPIDVCEAFNGGCHMFATCTATGPGTRTCACPAGFAGDGVTHCDPIDVCEAQNGGCHMFATCTATGPGTRTCACPAGFAGDGISGCDPIDVCEAFNGGCHMFATCTATGPGTRTCTCPAGFAGDGISGCDPIDVCEAFNGGCHMFATCTTTGPGTRACACPAGFAGDGVTHCDPIDLCTTLPNGGCSPLATCIPTGPGTRVCECRPEQVACMPGFVLDPDTCECVLSVGLCGPNQVPGPNGCVCVAQAQCAAGQVFDPVTCACQCGVVECLAGEARFLDAATGCPVCESDFDPTVVRALALLDDLEERVVCDGIAAERGVLDGAATTWVVALGSQADTCASDSPNALNHTASFAVALPAGSGPRSIDIVFGGPLADISCVVALHDSRMGPGSGPTGRRPMPARAAGAAPTWPTTARPMRSMWSASGLARALSPSPLRWT